MLAQARSAAENPKDTRIVKQHKSKFDKQKSRSHHHLYRFHTPHLHL